MKKELEAALAALVKDVFGVDARVELTRPDEQFGDFATNVALHLAGKLNKNPREIAEVLAEKLRSALAEKINNVSVAGAGFINLRLSDETLQTELDKMDGDYGRSDKYSGQVAVAEYSDPNPFKVLHAGHLYTSVVGDAIANLLEYAGAEVHRVNFGGDVGLHVAKTMYDILKHFNLDGNIDESFALTQINSLKTSALHTRASFLAVRYRQGNRSYETSDAAKVEINKLNKKIYALVETSDHDSSLAQMYWTCRQWSYDYFDEFYTKIGTRFDKYYPESETAPVGLAAIKSHPEVFENSDGATIFDGEKYGLHKRVFVTSAGLPTYETKDMGATLAKYDDYKFDKQIIITGNEQTQYMAVVLKAVEQFAPELTHATTHLTHGLVKLAGGVKMSSRKGNILRAVDVLDAAAEANKAAHGNNDERVTLGAVKYAFLRQRLGGDIIYDPKESVNLRGNSGPYLQYAYVRAVHILEKAKNQPGKLFDYQFNPSERSLVRKLSEHPEVIEQAINDMLPHHICTYLYELAQVFNRFYENNRVIGSDKEIGRLTLVAAYAGILKNGLGLLGIPAPEKM